MEGRRVIIIWIAVTVTVMFALPFAVARLASECSGMGMDGNGNKQLSGQQKQK